MKVLSPTWKFLQPMMRTIWIALAGQGIFIFSVITMGPLRMWKNPVVNYNLYYVPVMALLFGFLFYRTCTEEKESKAYLYGFFAALIGWPVLGEVPSIPVDAGLITRFSTVDIKLLGSYYYVIGAWILLKIMWRTGALKRSVCVFFLTFLCIWSFELYMENYTAKISVEMMPTIGSAVAAVFGILSVIILALAWRARSIEQKTVLGCLLYITFALVIMGSGQWQKPNAFYLKYESAHIDHELMELQEEKEHLEALRAYMVEKGMAKAEDLTRKSPAEPEQHTDK